MSSEDSHRSQSQFGPSQSPYSSSYPSAIIESLQAGPAARRTISPTIPTPQFGPPTAGQDDLTGGPRDPAAGPPGPASTLEPAYPAPGIANPPSDFSQTRADPWYASRLRGEEAARSVPEYGMASYPVAMGMAQEFFPGQIPQNPNVWPNRPSRPPSTMDQPVPQSQLLSSPGYLGYSAQQGGPAQGYYQPGRHSGQYMGQQIRSPSIHYPGPSASSIAGSPPLPDQPFVPSSPNMLNQQDYYFAEQSSLPSTQSSLPVSPQSQPQPQPTLHSHSHPQSHAQPPYYSSPESAAELERKVRVVGSRPRPQCWEHGCNGREFSTFSNLLRHQREKSGAVAKAECPACGAVFTRSTARNIHVAQGKCKGVD